MIQPRWAEADSEGADALDPINSQGYLAHVATGAIFLIQADNPTIGLVGSIAIGMSEVSSCLIGPDMTPGHHVSKGEELGYFQFGGSTHCLLFRPGAIADFNVTANPTPTPPTHPGEGPHPPRHRNPPPVTPGTPTVVVRPSTES